jgi:ubiquinone/menaquinone biosynthesis C-methylase UbiE
LTGSQSFDRAAACYDRTRITDPSELEAALGHLDATLPAGAVLEIGVGTGALAVPLAQRGRRVVGIDLAPSMLEQLRTKDHARVVRVAVADATSLPFADGSFAGAYCRWVLHLIPDWELAVAELCRVTAAGGSLMIEPGGYSGEWRAVHERFVQELGPAAEPVGLRAGDAYAQLDAACTRAGATLREVVVTPGSSESSLGRFLREVEERSFSWTWRVSEADLDRAIPVVRAWAIERYGPELEAPFRTAAPHRWRVYDLG